MNCKESDWKLFRKLIPVCQERYMTKLNKEYIGILIQDKKASIKMWINLYEPTINKSSN